MSLSDNKFILRKTDINTTRCVRLEAYVRRNTLRLQWQHYKPRKNNRYPITAAVRKLTPSYLRWSVDFSAWPCALICLCCWLQGPWSGRWKRAWTAHWCQVEGWWKGRKAHSCRGCHSWTVIRWIWSLPSTPPTSTIQWTKQQLQQCRVQTHTLLWFSKSDKDSILILQLHSASSPTSKLKMYFQTQVAWSLSACTSLSLFSNT
jgi:hypothetical protein